MQNIQLAERELQALAITQIRPAQQQQQHQPDGSGPNAVTLLQLAAMAGNNHQYGGSWPGSTAPVSSHSPGPSIPTKYESGSTTSSSASITPVASVGSSVFEAEREGTYAPSQSANASVFAHAAAGMPLPETKPGSAVLSSHHGQWQSEEGNGGRGDSGLVHPPAGSFSPGSSRGGAASGRVGKGGVALGGRSPDRMRSTGGEAVSHTADTAGTAGTAGMHEGTGMHGGVQHGSSAGSRGLGLTSSSAAREKKEAELLLLRLQQVTRSGAPRSEQHLCHARLLPKGMGSTLMSKP